MQNYVKKFSQFIGESKDWFEHTADPTGWRYTTQGGWRQKGQAEYDEMGEPDEEIETEDFLSRHQKEIAPHNAEWMRKLAPGKVKVWKDRPAPTAPSKIQSMSDDDLLNAHRVLKDSQALHVGSKDGPAAHRVLNIIREIEDEISARGL